MNEDRAFEIAHAIVNAISAGLGVSISPVDGSHIAADIVHAILPKPGDRAAHLPDAHGFVAVEQSPPQHRNRKSSNNT